MVSELIKISKYAGMREDLVQAGGGNTSVKTKEDEMLIKGMGIQLADIRDNHGYSCVNPQIFRDFFAGGQTQVDEELGETLQNQAYISGPRPAIETFLHAMTDTVTLHVHPMLVNVLTSRTGGMEVLKQLFPDAIMVDYATPGIDIGMEYFLKCKDRLINRSTSGIAFMKNHGLIVSGKSADEVIDRTEDVISRIAEYLGYDNTANQNVTKIYNILSRVVDTTEDIVYRAAAQGILQSADLLPQNRHTFCPDSVVFCGKSILALEEGNEFEQLKAFVSEYGKPSVIVYRNQAYIIASSVKKAKETESVLSFCAEVCELNKNIPMDLLPEQEVDFLLNWEVEKFRKNMA